MAIISYLAINPAFARLGETEALCTSRYGQKVASTDAGIARVVEYIKGDFVIVITFSSGKSVCETYKKRTQNLSDAEINEILAKNGGANWTHDGNGSNNMRWSAPDGSDTGATNNGGTLVIWAVGGREALSAVRNFQDQQEQATNQNKAQQTTSGL
jgi:hypothetical protein